MAGDADASIIPLQQHGLFRTKQTKTSSKFGMAEKKILVILCYYVILGAVALTTFTITIGSVERLTNELEQYFLCEAVGPEDPCDRSEFEKLTHPELIGLSYVLLGLLPAVNLFFVINVNELKQWCVQVVQFHVPRSSDYPSTSIT